MPRAGKPRASRSPADRATLRGWQCTPLDGAKHAGTLDSSRQMEVTLVLRPRKPIARSRRPLTHDDLARHHSAAPADVARVRAFARTHGLTVTPGSPHHCSVTLSGSADAFARAFHIRFDGFDHPHSPYFAPSTTPTIPASLKDIVKAVLGLHSRPIVRRHHHWFSPTKGTRPQVPQLAETYSFPRDADGTGQTIALIELGGGFRLADIHALCSSNNLPTPRITTVEVNGASNQPAPRARVRELLDFVNGRLQLAAAEQSSPAIESAQATVEVTMDLEILAALAPGAHIVVYFSTPDEQGFYRAITHAIHDTTNRPGILSISWGEPETAVSPAWSRLVNEAFLAASRRGITILASSGDLGALNNSPDGKPAVNFPASSPFAIACGGTTPRGTAPSREEIVWNATHFGVKGASGGGISRRFPLPTWQRHARIPLGPTGKPGRGVPDVAGPADPRYGSEILVAGATCSTAGTSAVVPLWAALVARLNQSLGMRLGHLNPLLYQIAQTGDHAFRPVTQGNNGAYKAHPGWNPCAGYGTLHGERLLNQLRARLSPRRNNLLTLASKEK